MSDTTIDFSTDAILQRMRDGLENPANKLEGGFCMDNLQAVAEEMARMDAMEVQPIPDHVLLDTAEGEYLDRKALDYNETRNPAAASAAMRTMTHRSGIWSRPIMTPMPIAGGVMSLATPLPSARFLLKEGISCPFVLTTMPLILPGRTLPLTGSPSLLRLRGG